MQTALPLDVLTETSGTDAAAVARLTAELRGAAAKVAAKDGEIDAIKRRHASELAAVVAHSLDADALDEAVASRIALIGAAKSILGAEFDPSGKSDLAIRRMAAEQKLGPGKLADHDDAYVRIAFDTLVASMVNNHPVQTSTPAGMQSGPPGIQPSYAIAAYNAQMGGNNKLYAAAHGHADVEHAVRLSFGWVQQGVQGQNQQQPHV